MTEEDLQKLEQKPDEVPAEAPTSEDSEIEADNKSEMLHKNIVSKIVERERQKAYEKGQRDKLMQMQQEQLQGQQGEVAPQQQPQQAGSLGGMQQMSQSDIEKLIAERTPQLLQEHIQGHVQKMQNDQLVTSFVAKMQAAEQKYPGLEKKLSELDYETMTPLIKLANNMDNTGDIMNELLDNPMKMGNMLTLMYSQPRIAEKAMQDLSSSIKTNQDALSAEAQARDPMSQLKPSSSAGMESGAMSVNDFRKMFSKKR